MAERYLLFLPASHGYELVDREGDLPLVGSEVEVEGDSHRYIATKIASSPLPDDGRRCVYVQRAP